MKIKDLLRFHAFIGAEFINYITYEEIISDDFEFEDIVRIENVEKIEYIGKEKFACLHRWLRVYVMPKGADEG